MDGEEGRKAVSHVVTFSSGSLATLYRFKLPTSKTPPSQRPSTITISSINAACLFAEAVVAVALPPVLIGEASVLVVVSRMKPLGC